VCCCCRPQPERNPPSQIPNPRRTSTHLPISQHQAACLAALPSGEGGGVRQPTTSLRPPPPSPVPITHCLLPPPAAPQYWLDSIQRNLSFAPHPPFSTPSAFPSPLPSHPLPIFLLIPGIRSGKRTLSLQPPTRHHHWLFIDSWHLGFSPRVPISCRLPPRKIWRVKLECSRLTNRSTWISRKLLNNSLRLILRSKNRTDGYQLQTVSQVSCPSISAYTSRFVFMLVGGEKKSSTHTKSFSRNSIHSSTPTLHIPPPSPPPQSAP